MLDCRLLCPGPVNSRAGAARGSRSRRCSRAPMAGPGAVEHWRLVRHDDRHCQLILVHGQLLTLSRRWQTMTIGEASLATSRRSSSRGARVVSAPLVLGWSCEHGLGEQCSQRWVIGRLGLRHASPHRCRSGCTCRTTRIIEADGATAPTLTAGTKQECPRHRRCKHLSLPVIHCRPSGISG